MARETVIGLAVVEVVVVETVVVEVVDKASVELAMITLLVVGAMDGVVEGGKVVVVLLLAGTMVVAFVTVTGKVGDTFGASDVVVEVVVVGAGVVVVVVVVVVDVDDSGLTVVVVVVVVVLELGSAEVSVVKTEVVLDGVGLELLLDFKSTPKLSLEGETIWRTGTDGDSLNSLEVTEGGRVLAVWLELNCSKVDCSLVAFTEALMVVATASVCALGNDVEVSTGNGASVATFCGGGVAVLV